MKLRTMLAVFTLLVFAVPSIFAGSILVVDDDDNYNNESKLYTALDNIGIFYDTYDCGLQTSTPDSAAMSAYDLVIWFTGSDGAATYFWNGTDSDNDQVKGYLNQGGKLWAWGIDLIYDRFGGAADTFAVGDFVYDYMGISSYDAQSKTGLDTLGVPQLDQTTNIISTIDPIAWNYSTLYYVDGVSLVAGAVSHYEMGPESYVYSGLSTVQSYTDGNFMVLSSLFKNWNFDTDANRETWIGDVITWFNLPAEPVTAEILVVDDDNYQNYEHSLYKSLDSTGFVYDTYDTDSLGSPDAAFLSAYKLVIWYTGNDSYNLNFWDGIDADNLALMNYLDNGGRLWINGLDLLYDRYGGAPDTFGPGDFPYDYMGLASYDVQSKADDAPDAGVPAIIQSTVNQLTTVDTLTWRFSTAWYIDGVTSNYRSFDNYTMGPDTYSLAGVTNVNHHVGNGFVVLNTLFNYNHIVSDSVRDLFTTGVIDWFQTTANGNAPTATNLSSPADAATLDIFVADSADVNFVWDASTDVEGLSGYRFLLGKSASDIAGIMMVDQATPGFTINEHELYNMIPAFENSVELFWQVLAYDADHNITESAISAFTVMRDAGPGPSPFTLLEPHNGAMIRVDSINVHDVPFVWQASIDPDGLAVNYTFQLMDNTNAVVHTVSVGTDSTTVVSSDAILAALGSDPAMEMAWIVVATDGEFETNAMSQHKLMVANAPPQLANILVVDDDDRYNNESKLFEALKANYYTYDIFSAPAEGRSPTLVEMAPYDLVIWFSGSDGVGLYFWNGVEEDNNAIAQYLDQGGRMWAFGADMLYDRYGSAPDFFGPGEMIYDYFGTSAYLAQTWANDDNVGLEMLLKDAGTAVTNMDTIRWNGGIVKYVDGCALGEGALPDLKFGPDAYQLADMANSYHTTDGNYITMSTWFNPYYMVDDVARAHFVGDVVSWFEKTLVPATLASPVLTAPAAGAPIMLSAIEDEFTFSWERITAPETVYYQLIVSSDAEGVIPFVVTTMDTTVTLSGNDVFKLSGFGADTLSLKWEVTAQTALADYSTSGIQAHVFVEGINEAPFAFDLLLPEVDSIVTINTLDEVLTFSWTPSFDPEGDAINYQFILVGATDTLINVNTADTTISIAAPDLIGAMGTALEVTTFWKVFAQDSEFSTGAPPQILYLENAVVGVSDKEIPDTYKLYQNYPNPFNPTTQIRYDLPEVAEVKLTIYDITGRVVNQLQVGSQEAGAYSVQWNGVSQSGLRVSTGIYLCRIQTASYSSVVKMLYLK